MSETFTFNTIEEILEDLKAGKNIILIDDEDRENEGDVICAAEFATLENVNFMAAHARGPVSYTHLDVYKRQVPEMTPVDSKLIVKE